MLFILPRMTSRRVHVAEIIANADAGYVGAVGSAAHIKFAEETGTAIFAGLRAILTDAPAGAPVDVGLMRQLFSAYDRFEHHYDGLEHTGASRIKMLMASLKTVFLSALINAQSTATN